MSVEQDINTLPDYPGEVVSAGSVAPLPEPALAAATDPVSVPEPTPVPVEPVEAVSEAPTPVNPDAPKAEPARSETERLDPQPLEMKLLSGTEFDLEPLKLRQFLRLLRIVTRGAADVLDQAQINFNDGDAFVQQFLGMVLFSIPEAEEETVEFIKSMVRPANVTGNPDKDLLALRELLAEIENPELEDVLTIVQAIIEKEAEDLRALGKRLGSMFAVAQKMGVTKSNPTPTTTG